MSDYDDSFEESEDDCGLLKQALHVEFPENFNPDKVPQTGILSFFSETQIRIVFFR